MPQDDLISQYIDEASFRKQTDFAIGQIDRLLGALDKIGTAKIDFSGAQGITQIKAAVQQVEAASDDLVASTQTLTASIQQQRQEMVKNGTVLNQMEKETVAAANAATALGNAHYGAAQKMKAETAESEKLTKAKKDLVFANSEENVQLQGLALQRAESNKGAKAEAAAAIGLNDAYKTLTLEYEASLRNAKNVAIQFGVNSAEAKAARIETLAMGTQLKVVDESLGQYQKNVGNYTNSISKAFGFVRQLAYILPGIGIAGLFNLAFEGVAALIEVLEKALTKINDYGQYMKALGDVNLKAAENTSKTKAQIEGLTAVLNDGTASLADKERATQDLIALDPKFLSGINQVNAATAEGKKILDAYLLSLKGKEEYEAAKSIFAGAENDKGQLEIAKKLLTDRLEAIKKGNKSYFNELTDEEKKFVDNGIKPLASLVNLEIDEPTIKQALGNIDDALKNANSKAGASLKVLTDKFKDNKPVDLGIVEGLKQGIEKLDKEIEVEADPSKLKALVKLKEFIQNQLNLATNAKAPEIKPEQNKYDDPSNLKQQAEDEQKLSENVSLQLKSRLDAREAAAAAEIKLSNQTAQVEIANEAAKLAAAKNKPGASPAELASADNEYNSKVKEISQKAAKEQRDIELNKTRDLIGIRQSAAAESKAIDEQYLKDTNAIFDDQDTSKVRNFQKEKEAAIEALDDRYNAQIKAAKGNQGKIKALENQYAIDRANIEFDYAAKVLKTEIDLAEKLIATHKLQGKNVKNEELALADLRTSLSDLTLKHTIDNNTKGEKSDTEYFDKLTKNLKTAQQIASDVFKVIGEVVSAGVTKEKNALQAQSDALDVKTKHDIDAVNASTDAQQTKANKIAIIDAKAQAQKDIIASKQRQADQRQAKFDKEKTIMELVFNTAIAVIGALKPDGKTPLPARIAAAIAIGVLGAAEIAAVAAAPIPKYREGTKNKPHPGGWAIMGEGGKSEYVILPGGRSFVTSNRAELYDLPAGTQVYPDVQKLSREMFEGSMKSLKALPSLKPDAHLDVAIGKKLDRLTQTVKDKRELHLRYSTGSFMAMHKYGDNWLQYIDQRTKTFL